MKSFVRMLGRLAVIALTAALFSGLITLYARTMHAPVNRGRGPGDRRGRNIRRDGFGRDGSGNPGQRSDRPGLPDRPDQPRRPDLPEPRRFPEIIKQSALLAVVTFAGRRFLRLRL